MLRTYSSEDIARSGLSVSDLEFRGRKRRRAMQYPPHVVAGTGANEVLAIGGVTEWPA